MVRSKHIPSLNLDTASSSTSVPPGVMSPSGIVKTGAIFSKLTITSPLAGTTYEAGYFGYGALSPKLLSPNSTTLETGTHSTQNTSQNLVDESHIYELDIEEENNPDQENDQVLQEQEQQPDLAQDDDFGDNQNNESRTVNKQKVPTTISLFTQDDDDYALEHFSSYEIESHHDKSSSPAIDSGFDLDSHDGNDHDNDAFNVPRQVPATDRSPILKLRMHDSDSNVASTRPGVVFDKEDADFMPVKFSGYSNSESRPALFSEPVSLGRRVSDAIRMKIKLGHEEVHPVTSGVDSSGIDKQGLPPGCSRANADSVTTFYDDRTHIKTKFTPVSGFGVDSSVDSIAAPRRASDLLSIFSKRGNSNSDLDKNSSQVQQQEITKPKKGIKNHKITINVDTGNELSRPPLSARFKKHNSNAQAPFTPRGHLLGQERRQARSDAARPDREKGNTARPEPAKVLPEATDKDAKTTANDSGLNLSETLVVVGSPEKEGRSSRLIDALKNSTRKTPTFSRRERSNPNSPKANPTSPKANPTSPKPNPTSPKANSISPRPRAVTSQSTSSSRESIHISCQASPRELVHISRPTSPAAASSSRELSPAGDISASGDIKSVRRPSLLSPRRMRASRANSTVNDSQNQPNLWETENMSQKNGFLDVEQKVLASNRKLKLFKGNLKTKAKKSTEEDSESSTNLSMTNEANKPDNKKSDKSLVLVSILKNFKISNGKHTLYEAYLDLEHQLNEQDSQIDSSLVDEKALSASGQRICEWFVVNGYARNREESRSLCSVLMDSGVIQNLKNRHDEEFVDSPTTYYWLVMVLDEDRLTGKTLGNSAVHAKKKGNKLKKLFSGQTKN